MTNKNVRLTPRDIKVLSRCYHHTFMTFAQIQSRIFPNAQRVTVQNRLTQLCSAGFLTKVRVGKAISHGSEIIVGVVYQITKGGIRILKVLQPSGQWRDEPVPLILANLSHDYLLSECLWGLEKRFSEFTVVHGRNTDSTFEGQSRAPDAVILDKENRVWAAVELELTAKSERRYRQIVLHYRLSSKYPRVIYVVRNESIAAKIRYQITNQKETIGHKKIPTGKFHFVTVDNFLRDPDCVGITNGETECPKTPNLKANMTFGNNYCG